MPHVRLTDLAISKLPHQKAQITYWDEALPAFGVRVGARRKTFIVILNRGRRIKLGTYVQRHATLTPVLPHLRMLPGRGRYGGI